MVTGARTSTKRRHVTRLTAVAEFDSIERAVERRIGSSNARGLRDEAARSEVRAGKRTNEGNRREAHAFHLLVEDVSRKGLLGGLAELGDDHPLGDVDAGHLPDLDDSLRAALVLLLTHHRAGL
eukprot:764096-Hanusia_phi.AAC.4